jgi:toxoflavin synthase
MQGKNQYSEIAVEYKKSKMLRFRTESETPTFMKLLGENLGDKNIVDFACGEGFYTRKIREISSGRVMGVDISPEMIELAKRQEGPETQIEYLIQDCCKSEFTEKYAEMFDDVTATFLLNYAT